MNYPYIKIFEETKQLFQTHGIPSPESDALWILQDCLQLHNHLDLYLERNKNLDAKQLETIRILSQQRIQGKPLQYILGHTNFFGFQLKVNQHVLIPRPETEILVELVLEKLKKQLRPCHILDIGTGSGNISIVLAKMANCTITAIDLNDQILHIATQNAQYHQVLEKITFKKSNLFDNLSPDEQFDFIVSNPPYIQDIQDLPKEIKDFEPLEALSGGLEGLEIIKKIINNAKKYLSKNGRIFLEISSLDQSEKVINIFKQNGDYKNINIHKDLSGQDRVAEAIKN